MMDTRYWLLLLCFTILACFNLHSQDTDFDTTVSKKHSGFLIYPSLSYSPETRIQAGVSAVFFFRGLKADSSYRPSVIHPHFAYTQNKQSFIECNYQLFFIKENYYLYGNIAYFNFPYIFYGIGNHIAEDYQETYTSTYGTLNLNVLRKIVPYFYAGLKIQTSDYKIDNILSGYMLNDLQITGISGGYNSGLGPMILYDSRDNIFSAFKGTYIELSSVINSRNIFSEYTYNSYLFDIRKFYNISKGHILAFQSYTNLNTGNIPFYNLALLGGNKRMRGYYEGRYRDRNYSMCQVEYRSPFIKNRVGAAIFTGYGLVFNRIEDISEEYFKPSYGAGLRLRFNRKERIHFRMDIAVGYKSVGYYLALSEAF